MATQYQCGFPVVLRDKKARTTSNNCIYYIFYIFNLFFQVRFTDISQGDSNGRRISKNISTCFRFSMGVVYFISVYHGSFFTAVSGWRLTFTTVPWIGRQSIHRPLSVFDPGRTHHLFPLSVGICAPWVAPPGGGSALLTNQWTCGRTRTQGRCPWHGKTALPATPKKAFGAMPDSLSMGCHNAAKVPAIVRISRKRSTWNRHLRIDFGPN